MMKVLGRDRSDYPLPIFYDEMYKLVDDPSTDSIISWSKSNKGFIIRNEEELIRSKIYSRFFCSTFEMFITTLDGYIWFEEIERSDGLREFGNKNFVRGEHVLMTEMDIKNVMKRMNKYLDPIIPSTVERSFEQFDDLDGDRLKDFASECLDAFGF